MQGCPVVEEVSRKRKLVEDGVAVLVSSSSTAAQRFVREDLSATLTTCDGCKQMLDRQMAAMAEMRRNSVMTDVVLRGSSLEDPSTRWPADQSVNHGWSPV